MKTWWVCEDSGQAVPKYLTIAYWLLWISVTWPASCARRSPWPSLVLLNARNKSTLEGILSALGGLRETTSSLELRVLCKQILFPLDSFTTQAQALFRFLTNEYPNLAQIPFQWTLIFFLVLPIHHKFIVYVGIFCLNGENTD